MAPTDEAESRTDSSTSAPRATEQISTYLFSSDESAPRRRRPSDVATFATMAVIFTLLGWAASAGAPIDARTTAFLIGLPDWLRTLAWIGFTGSSLAAFALIFLVVLRGGLSQGVVRDLVIALTLILGFGLAAGRATSGQWPNFLPEISDIASVPPYPTVRIATVVAIAWVLMPYVTRPVQQSLRFVVFTVSLSPLVLNLTTLTGLFGALALGSLSVAAVHLLFGSPEGLPPVGRLTDTLERIGVPTTELRYLPDQPGTVGLATARSDDGETILIKIYGRDAARSQRAERVWRALWYKASGPAPSAGQLEQAQREALVLLVAAQAGVTVPAVLRGGQDAGGDVILAVINPDGEALGDLDQDDVNDEMLHAMWREMIALHEDSIVHGAIGPETVQFGQGGVSFVGFRNGSAIGSTQQKAADAVGLLATTAAVVGAERALDAAAALADETQLATIGPFMQDAVIEPGLRKWLKHSGLKLSKLRGQLAERLGVEEPQLVEIRRITWTNVAMVVGLAIAASVLVSQFADVDFDTLTEDLKDTSLGWLLAAFVIRLGNYTVPYIGLKAVVQGRLPFGPTALVQSAKSYIGLILPSTVGSVSMDIAYLQKLGTPAAVAAAQGPVIGFFGFLVEIALLLATAWAMGQEVDTGDGLDINIGLLIGAAVVVVLVGIGIAAFVPKYRNMILPPLKQAWQGIRNMVSTPTKVARIFGSEILQRLVSALALGAVVIAFGQSLSFSALIFVSVGTGLLAGLSPTPGGIGVAEATLTSLLTAVGIPAELSFTIAITYRILTSYLPPVLGFFS
ncbi:MAG: lysylphosphatidylglycerol synthase domain-containing protein, partial [Acidimicrobiales bacterium]